MSDLDRVDAREMVVASMSGLARQRAGANPCRDHPAGLGQPFADLGTPSFQIAPSRRDQRVRAGAEF